MRNYIKAELYRSFNRVYFWGMTAGFALTALLFNGLFLYMSHKWGQVISLANLIEGGIMILSAPFYIIVVFSDMITSEEQKNLTLKNVIGNGLSRYKMYLGKLIATIILAFISAGIILGVYLGSGLVLFGLGDTFSMGLLQDFCLRIAAAIPLWISGITLLTFLAMLIKNNTLFAMVYIVFVGVVPSIFKLLGHFVSEIFMMIYQYLPTTQLQMLTQTRALTNDLFMSSIVTGLAYTLIFTIIGLIYTNRKVIH